MAFGWKRTGRGRYGSIGVRIRFFDELRGERFFDTEFAVSGVPGQVTLDCWMKHDRSYGGTAKATGIVEALTVGIQLQFCPEEITPRGTKALRSFTVSVKSASVDSDGRVTITYEEIG